MDWGSIALKLQMLREVHADLRCFGAAAHAYQFLPPVPEGTVVAFERRHRVELPSEYREFLTKVGNGGAGPGYGVFPLGKYREDHGPQTAARVLGDLAPPSPHAEPWDASEEYCSREPDIGADEEAYWQ